MSDIMGPIAHPVETISREPEAKAIETIKKYCKDNDIKQIVAGLPKNMNNTIGEQAQDCINFAEKFKGVDPDDLHLEASYSGNPEEAAEWKKEIEEHFPGMEIYMAPLSLSVSCHIGPGALAVTVTHKIRY